MIGVGIDEELSMDLEDMRTDPGQDGSPGVEALEIPKRRFRHDEHEFRKQVQTRHAEGQEVAKGKPERDAGGEAPSNGLRGFWPRIAIGSGVCIWNRLCHW
jgi:hypothetical protein